MTETELRDWISLFAAIGNLSLAATSLLSGRNSTMGRPIAAFCFVLFGWNFATLGHHVFGGDALNVLDAIFTSLSPPLLFEVIAAFCGQSRKRRIERVLVWLVFGGIALASLGGMVSRPLLAWIDAPSWALLFLIGWVPSVTVNVVLMVRHLKRTTDSREKARARTVLAALAIGASFSTSDIAHGLGFPAPYLAAIGSLLVAALLTTSVVRFDLFDRSVSVRSTMYVIVMIAAFVLAYLVLFRSFSGSLTAQLFGATIVTLLLAAVARELGISFAESRDRVQRLAVLGRFSAQMSHDVKGPLSALLGAVQVLEGEKREEQREELLTLAVDQARRIAAIVDRYDRMARVEPRKTLVRVNEVVRAVARAHSVSEERLALDEADPECEADRDLVESAVENVVRNAVEATRGRGEVRVETLRLDARVIVRVVDTGVGMDARQSERAFEDFFTTKETGSGLGLAFVRRVLLAHGGDVMLESEQGKGTRVELRLPA